MSDPTCGTDEVVSSAIRSATGGLCTTLPTTMTKMDLTRRGKDLFARLRKKKSPNDNDNNDGGSSSLYDAYLCGLASSVVACDPFDIDVDVDDKKEEEGEEAKKKKKKKYDVDVEEEGEEVTNVIDGIHDDIDNTDTDVDVDDVPIPACRLDDTRRTVCVVTTAALPWRTGTAVNPLLRALYLVRLRVVEEAERKRSRLRSNHDNDDGDTTTAKNDGNDDDYDDDDAPPLGDVALVVPWLESREERIKLYGEELSFSSSSSPSRSFPSAADGDEEDNDEDDGEDKEEEEDDDERGMAMQEEWIRNYSATSCMMPIESRRLMIIFYPAFYLAPFGSIFPKVDLCNYVPSGLVDIAILEEPEHLNWFRMPNYHHVVKDGGGKGGGSSSSSSSSSSSRERKAGVGGGGRGRVRGRGRGRDGGEDGGRDGGGEGVERADKEDIEGEGEGVEVGDDGGEVAVAAATSSGVVVRSLHAPRDDEDDDDVRKTTKLGWTHRFRFVIGIVHTNYEEYARQYGIGASMIAAPAIGAMSALTIRAHCHQVIKLSDTLPVFAPGKERTCNVHGVRAEFLEEGGMGAESAMTPKTTTTSGGEEEEEEEGRDEKGEGGGEAVVIDDDDDDDVSPVYFIGKLVWAKGFDQMLDLQDIYRKRHGNYFPVDVYGGGPDERAIVRAFHGRHHASATNRPPKTDQTTTLVRDNKGSSSSSVSRSTSLTDVNAAAVLANPQSIKEQLERLDRRLRGKERSSTTTATTATTEGCGDDVVSQYLSLGFEVSGITGSATYVGESRDNEDDRTTTANANPLDILGDLSGKSFDTGMKTSLAVYNIADSSIKNILTMSFSQLKEKKVSLKARMKKLRQELSPTAGGVDGATEEEEEKVFVFDPPASRYELRRRPIPAKFPGVVDHALLKNTPHKIFLNPSTSEVLCTTTAEALAMGKFAIIPRHPSNEFFVQFTNCLPYDTLEECADRVAWALSNAPTPLAEEERRKFTWEAATERLIESSIVTVGQARERSENGMDKTDARIAYWLSESGEKSNMIRNLFQKNSSGDDHSPSNGLFFGRD